MSTVERWACTNPLWRGLTGRAVIPWAFRGHELSGDILEIGSGAGANAAALLRRYPRTRLVATDVDPAMLDVARRRLDRFGDRVVVGMADAAALPFEGGSFDAVVSLLMLHHIGDWRSALVEVTRVLRPGGQLIGYDLTRSGPAARIHRRSGPGHVLATNEELRVGLGEAGLGSAQVRSALGGLVIRFSAAVVA